MDSKIYQVGDLVSVQFNYYESGTPMDYIPLYVGVITKLYDYPLSWKRNIIDDKSNKLFYKIYCFYMILEGWQICVNKYLEQDIENYEIRELISR